MVTGGVGVALGCVDPDAWPAGRAIIDSVVVLVSIALSLAVCLSIVTHQFRSCFV